MQRKSLCLALIGAMAFIAGTATAATRVVPFQGPSSSDQETFGRFIVKYRSGTVQRADSRKVASALNTRVANVLGANRTISTRHVRRLSANGADVVRTSRRLDMAEAKALMAAIAADPAVESVRIDRLLQHTAAPNDTYYATHQWDYYNPTGGINAPGAWDAGAKGDGIVVAVLDTGITKHSDLDANALEGYDFISDAFVSGRETDDRAPGGADLGDWTTAGMCGANSAAKDSSWHGSHVAGTVAEVTNNGIGMAGVAHNAKILPVRVLGHCGGYTSDIADAVVWASGGHVDGVPDNTQPAEVINMSLGGSGTCGPEMQAAIDGAVSRGTTIVIAAGNDNDDAMNHTPANCRNVITVGATGISARRAFYSNYGTRIDIAAPGGGYNDGANNQQNFIWSAGNEGKTVPEKETYMGMVGTSQATPHVAGVVALVQSAVATPMTPAQIASLLKQTARPFPAPTDRPLGAGIVDANAAVAAAKSTVPATLLSNGVARAGVTGAAGDELMYMVAVPAGAKLSVLTYGGTGQVKLFARAGDAPTAQSYDATSQRPGTNQTLTVPSTVAGLYYIKVVGVTAFSGVSIRATF